MTATFNRRYFRFDYVRGEGGQTGIGIVEYFRKGKRGAWENHVIAIHSIYDDNDMSVSQIQSFIAKHIKHRLLNENEGALIQAARFGKAQGLYAVYYPKIVIESKSTKTGLMYHAQLLAEDALRRKTDISEIFDEPMRFSVLEQYEEEQAHNEEQ